MVVRVGVSAEKKPDFLSRLVAFFLMRPYSHIFIIHDGFIYHSVTKGISSVEYNEYRASNHIIASKKVVLDCKPDIFINHFNFYKDLKYAESQVFGFIPFIGRLFNNGRKGAWCSEYVGWVLSDLGRRWEFAEGDISTPKMFEKIKGVAE